MNQEVLLITVAFFAILAGMAGIIIPVLPGLPLVWLGMLVFAYGTNFAFVTWPLLFIFLVIVLFASALDFIVPLIGAKKYKATREGVWGMVLGFVGGLFLFGPFGILIGPLAGLFFGELVSGKDWEEAFNSLKGILLGFLVAGLLKFFVALVILGILIFALL